MMPPVPKPWIVCHERHLAARCQERGYSFSEVQGCICISEPATGLIAVDPTHPAYPCRKHASPATPPSTVKRVCNWIKAVNRWMRAGKPIRTDEEVTRLVAICEGCKHYSGSGQCRACGCAVTKGAWAVTNKARMATEDCPKGKWSPGGP